MPLRLRGTIDGFKTLDSLAGLVPPPFVDLSFSHACASGDVQDFVSGPHELAILQFFNEYVQLRFGLSTAFAQFGLVCLLIAYFLASTDLNLSFHDTNFFIFTVSFLSQDLVFLLFYLTTTTPMVTRASPHLNTLAPAFDLYPHLLLTTLLYHRSRLRPTNTTLQRTLLPNIIL